MKFVLVINLAVLIVVLSVSSTQSANRFESGNGGWYIPLSNGTLEWMRDREADIERRKYEDSGEDPETEVEFYLYSPKNPDSPQKLRNPWNENTRLGLATKILIGDWRNSLDDDFNVKVRKAWLNRNHVNVLSVIWKPLKGNSYFDYRYSVRTVGEKITSTLQRFNSHNGLQFNSLTLIGHGLGAHLAGYVSKHLSITKTFRAGFIVGLDPALPLFNYVEHRTGWDLWYRLDDIDAKYVEVIHTNGGQWGFLKPLGNADYYPNGGKIQPGCGRDPNGDCSHARAIDYYVEALTKNTFPAIGCLSYKEAIAVRCEDSHSGVHMLDYNTKGSYYVPVNEEPPYSRNFIEDFY